MRFTERWQFLYHLRSVFSGRVYEVSVEQYLLGQMHIDFIKWHFEPKKLRHLRVFLQRGTLIIELGWPFNSKHDAVTRNSIIEYR